MSAISVIVARSSLMLEAKMDNASFWDNRYRLFPNLGSGQGSRRYASIYKSRLNKKIIREWDIRSIIDIGFGDLCWLDQDILGQCTYTGLDISNVAVNMAKEAYPSLQFFCHDVTSAPIGAKADLVVSYDVLIHQIDPSLFRLALAHTLAAISKIGLISYRTPPMPNGSFPPPETLDPGTVDSAALDSEIKFRPMVEDHGTDVPKPSSAFHGPLPAAVAEIGSAFEISVTGHYRYQTIYAIRPLSEAN
jgi:hypothetical protein